MATILLVFTSASAHSHGGYGDLAVIIVAGLFLVGGVGLHVLVGIVLLAMSKFASLKWLIPSLIWSALCVGAWVLVFGVLAKQTSPDRFMSSDGSTVYEFQGQEFSNWLLIAIGAVIVVLVIGPVMQYLKARQVSQTSKL